ncbi:MAG: SRPBCC family protein [Planctomycetes bacterium]|nr:SRPBCC family protein [Planctomycetota bacterium]
MLVAITESIVVARPPEAGFDFTQDYARRTSRDRGVLSAEVLERAPLPRVRVELAGGVRGVFEYKLFERPLRTSVALTEVRSPLFSGGGGSWSYEAHDGGTLWTVTNSVRFRSRIVGWLLGPWTRFVLRRGTRAALRAAKLELERG